MMNTRCYRLRFRTRLQAMRILTRLGEVTATHDDGRSVVFKAGNWVAVDAAGVETVLANANRVNWQSNNIDPIGDLYHPTGATLPDGSPEMVVSAGWHCNIVSVGPLRKKLRPFVVKPSYPKREYAGRAADMRDHEADVAPAEMLGMDATDASLDSITE